MSKTRLQILAVCVLLVQQSLGENEDICYSKMCNTSAANLLEYMDLEMDPCQDFYRFTCGKFLRNYELPENKVKFSAYEFLEEELQKNVRGVLEKPVGINASLYERVTKTFYKSCLNTDAIEEKGTAPILELFQQLGGWPILSDNWDENSVNLTSLLIKLNDLGFEELFAMAVYVEEKNSTIQLPVIFQPSVTFSKVDYPASLNGTKVNYLRTYINDTLNLLSISSNNERRAREIEEILSFEANLSKILLEPEEMRIKRHLLTTMRNLSRTFNKTLQFDVYVRGVFANAGINVQSDQLIEIYYPAYIRRLPQLLENTPPKNIINYLIWNVFTEFISALPRSFQNVSNRFYKGLGVFEESRWKECFTITNDILQGPVGALYVKEYFKSSAKEKMLHLIEELKMALKHMINESVWMTKETKEMAREKANAMKQTIGFPDDFLRPDYFEDVVPQDTMDIDSFLKNWVYLKTSTSRNEKSFLVKKFKNDTLLSSVVEINSFYIPNMNAIEFPAGILQYPFFNDEVPMYQNFGGIGYIIGHEITHGFDDTGRLYNKDGNALPWWKPEDSNKFDNLSSCFVDLYNGFMERDLNASVNGFLTLGENIADIGGLRESFTAYKSWTRKFGSDPRLPGFEFSPEQMFFIYFGKINCVKIKPNIQLHLLKTDEHSPGEFRVNGAVMSLREFSETFNCPRNTAMNPESKCHIW